jgi:hypothetical protein
VSEHEPEPIPGLPALLPPGERILWQGGPDWRSFAVHGFHVRKLALYFALLVAWQLVAPLSGTGSAATGAGNALSFAILALVAIGTLCLLAWLIARSTVYTITSRRLVMRFGVALPMTLNLPFAVVDSVALRTHRDGTADLPIATTSGARIGYIITWPHVRPWKLARAQACLRSIPDGQRVAGLLAAALVAAVGGAQSAPAPAVSPVNDDSSRASRPPQAAGLSAAV